MALCSNNIGTTDARAGFRIPTSPPPPPHPAITSSDSAAAAQAATGQQQFDWFRQAYEGGAAERTAAAARAREIGDASLGAMRSQSARAADYSDFERSTYRPLQQRIVADATGYDSPERREAAATGARADVGIAANQQQGALQRTLARSGVNPGSTASMALASDAGFQATKASAGAAGLARRNVEDTGFARMTGAAGMGSYLPGAANAAANVSLSAGQNAGAASTEALRASTSGVPLMEQAFTGKQQSLQSAGNLYAQSAALRNNGQSNSGANFGQVLAGVGGLAQGVGQLWPTMASDVGSWAGDIGSWFSSSKKLKTKKGDVKTDEALAQVNALDVDSWQYKQGVADEGQHIGPYAEDVRDQMGERAAPGGKMIDLALMSDRNAQAIKSLTSQLQKIESVIASMEA